MTDCEHCATDSGVYDMRRPCCAARKAEQTIRDDSARTVNLIAAKHGHDADDMRARIAAMRRSRRSASADAAR